ncbi:hypothetical protein, partial [Yersinia thracica]
IVEIDEHLPSMKIDIKVSIKKFSYSLNLNTQVWIECEMFSKFIEAMSNSEIAIFNDMNRLFDLTIDTIKGRLHWSCAKEDLNGCMTIAKGEEILTTESRDAIYNTFNDHPRWW